MEERSNFSHRNIQGVREKLCFFEEFLPPLPRHNWADDAIGCTAIDQPANKSRERTLRSRMSCCCPPAQPGMGSSEFGGGGFCILRDTYVFPL